MREKSEMLHFRVSPQELERIRQKKDEIGIRNMGAFLRKMAMDGYCFNMDTRPVLEISSLIRRCSNNLNQYAKRANETGSIYAEDIKDLQVRLDEIWEKQCELLTKLSHIK